MPGLDRKVLDGLENVDIIWLERGVVPRALIEVEHITDPRSGLLKMTNIFEVAPHLDVHLFTVLPDKKVIKLKNIIDEPSIKRLIGKREVYYA